MKAPGSPFSIPRAMVLPAGFFFLAGLGVWYARNNPQSILSYGLHRVGIDAFEPTYLARPAGQKMGFELISFGSRSELSTDKVGFRGCEENAHHPKAQPRQYIIHEVRCKTASHFGASGSVELSYFNDRLAAVRFLSSSNSGTYVNGFQKHFKINLKVGKRVRLSRNIYVVLRQTTDGFSVEWLDDRLEKENRSWIMKYA